MFHHIGIILFCYLIGSIPWGYLIGRFNGIDIRRHGSKNIGATNVVRTLGKSWGYFCFFLDFAKGFFPVWLVIHQSSTTLSANSWIPVLAAFMVVIGHCFPIYLQFKGGKGVATSIGVLVALAPIPLLGSMIIWLIIFHFSRYVSLASCSAAVMFPILGIFYRIQNESNQPSNPTILLMILLGAFIVYRHKTNIIRLRNGTENRFERKK